MGAKLVPLRAAARWPSRRCSVADTTERRARVERLIDAARIVSDPERAEGRELRARLLATTGLSSANIELGLSRCLELEPGAEHLEDLLASTPVSQRAHVLLSGNVFVAALRAIAIGVAASSSVQVRASRRDPSMAEALHALRPELFQLTSALRPAPGDHLWSYGSDETLGDLRASLPAGVWFHAHGAGFGAVVLEASRWRPSAARAIALDTALFDQRGCLSPRVVCVVGSPQQARDIAQDLARELAALELELPCGPQSLADAAELRRDRDAAAYAFELFDAASGWVSCATELVVPPSRRNLHVVPTADACRSLAPFAAHLTCVGSDPELHGRLRMAFPGARLALLGEMQRPALDGPVDRRRSPLGELL
jgi:acyl-CoA reductase LuxC